MVIIPLVIAVIAVFLFFGRGGLKSASAFFTPKTTTEMKEDPLVVDTLQSGEGSVPISAGSQRTVEDIEKQDIFRTDITDKRKFNPSSDKPKIKLFFNNPKAGGNLSQQRGNIIGANISGGFKFGQGKDLALNPLETFQIRRKQFTEQERQDIAKLRLRFQRKSVSAQQVSDQAEDIIFNKREQEAIAKKVIESRFGAGSFVLVGGKTAERFGLVEKGKTQQKLFAKPNFVFGGISEQEFLKQRAEKRIEFNRLEENRRKSSEEQSLGKVISAEILSTGLSQQEFLLTKGIALRGSPLNERALGKLQFQGLI